MLAQAALMWGAGRSTSKVAHSHAWQTSPGCWQGPSASYHVDLSTKLFECPHNIVVGFSQWVIPERTKRELRCLLWPSHRSHTLLFLQRLVVGVTGQLYLLWGEEHRAWASAGGSWGPSQRLVATKLFPGHVLYALYLYSALFFIISFSNHNDSIPFYKWKNISAICTIIL